MVSSKFQAVFTDISGSEVATSAFSRYRGKIFNRITVVIIAVKTLRRWTGPHYSRWLNRAKATPEMLLSVSEESGPFKGKDRRHETGYRSFSTANTKADPFTANDPVDGDFGPQPTTVG